MQHGIIQLSPSGYLRLTKGANTIDIKAPTSITTSYAVSWPSAAPGSTQALTIDSTGQLGYTSLGGTGTVSSVGLSVPTDLYTVSNSPVTTTGTLTLAYKSQTAGTFFAAPSGGAGIPSFRGIVWVDVSALAGTTGTSFAAGNDSRFHTQNTDTGTTQTSFQIDSGNTGPKIKNSTGVLEVRNSADTAYADIRVKNLYVTGATTTINSETIAVDDNILQLNSNVTSGTPTEDLGLEGLRGAQTSASFKWIESTGRWSAGLLGSELPVTRAYETTFTNVSLTAGVLTVTHNIGRRVVQVILSDGTNKIVIPDDITFTSTTVVTIDLTTYGTLSGTWTVVCIG